jgi:FlaA1/EpsC-like NDP-sugar epimerase
MSLLKKINSREARIVEFIFADILLIVAVIWIGMKFVLRQNLFDIENFYYIIALFVLVKILMLAIFGQYNLVLDFVGFIEAFRLFISVIASNLIIYLIYLCIDSSRFPFYFFVLITPLEYLSFIVLRFLKRIINRFKVFYTNPKERKRHLINTLVIGAGSGGKLVLDEITKNQNLKNKIVAFVDDSEEKIKKRLNGIPILGPISNSLEYVEKYNIQEVIIAIANIKPERLKEIISLFSNTSIKIKRLPLMTEINADSSRKIVDVKIEDLLCRGVVILDNDGLNSFIENKVVLVTGGGGSIGSELCHQILYYNPSVLIIFDIYENTTYEVQLELKKRIENEKRKTHLVVLIGSVYNEKRIESVFSTFHPQLVFHAAAYKHVPLMEDSAVEAVRTNVIGTYNVAHFADKYHVEKMVLVSTDKAVRPTNVMGATKACCEKIIQYFDSISDTNYSAVRFGNVLGSNGSVVPIFKRQIAEGGPITVTDKEITRFFMTIPEAVSLILQSGVYAKGGEIFILDMGEPVKIYDLAEKMIRLSGLIPNVDIKIVETGLRPGEKLYEELLVDKEKNIKTDNDKIFIERGQETVNIENFIQVIKDQFEVVSNQEVKQLVHKLIDSYMIDDKTSN